MLSLLLLAAGDICTSFVPPPCHPFVSVTNRETSPPLFVSGVGLCLLWGSASACSRWGSLSACAGGRPLFELGLGLCLRWESVCVRSRSLCLCWGSASVCVGVGLCLRGSRSLFALGVGLCLCWGSASVCAGGRPLLVLGVGFCLSWESASVCVGGRSLLSLCLCWGSVMLNACTHVRVHYVFECLISVPTRTHAPHCTYLYPSTPTYTHLHPSLPQPESCVDHDKFYSMYL